MKGNIFFRTQHKADTQTHQVIRAVEEIQT